jgi:8-oxo-dGTP diphosphatase
MIEINRFTIRVYGLLLTEENDILLSKEKIGDFQFTKFPGGGLEFGEGIADCLIREFKEEASIDVEIISHFYTTDFFQQSGFKKTDQLISVYYFVKSLDDIQTIKLDEFDIENKGRIEQQQFIWIPIEQLQADMVTFPIDKLVVQLLKDR